MVVSEYENTTTSDFIGRRPIIELQYQWMLGAVLLYQQCQPVCKQWSWGQASRHDKRRLNKHADQTSAHWLGLSHCNAYYAYL